MAEIFKFPGRPDRRRPPVAMTKASSRRGSSGVSIRTLCFRSRELILEANEADLFRDVCRDPHKAEVKLKAIQERLQSVREWSAAQTGMLTTAETKLTAAIVAALRSARGNDEAPAPIAADTRGRRCELMDILDGS